MSMNTGYLVAKIKCFEEVKVADRTGGCTSCNHFPVCAYWGSIGCVAMAEICRYRDFGRALNQRKRGGEGRC